MYKAATSKCNQRRLCKEDNCEFCYNNSFASHEKSKYWSISNDCTPRQVFKSAGKKYEFICGECNHNFLSSLYQITGKRKVWCSYCANQRLCHQDDCKICFNKSFASCIVGSKKWDIKKNVLLPRQVFRNARKKYWFKCEDCNHEYEVALYSITKENIEVCPYCVNRKICFNEECRSCYNKSFASDPRSKYISDRNPANPRLLFKNSNIRVEFKCEKCNNYFSSLLCNTSSLKTPRWCPFCKNKTEDKLRKFITENYSECIYQYKPKWCKSYITNKYLPFDFFIPSLNIIIELDGEQHFRQVLNWNNDPNHIQSKDLYKMKLAYDNGISVIRIPFKNIYHENLFLIYQEKLLEILSGITENSTPQIIYLCDDDKYNHFKDFDFNGDIIPEIVPDVYKDLDLSSLEILEEEEEL